MIGSDHSMMSRLLGVLQVERIQNKVLYQSYFEQLRRITERWANIEPFLQVVTRLWHGTSATDPSVIYDSEEGTSAAIKACLHMMMLV